MEMACAGCGCRVEAGLVVVRCPDSDCCCCKLPQVNAAELEPVAVSSVLAAYDRMRQELGVLVRETPSDDLGRSTKGTRWTNRELLFHMVLGFLVVRTLVRLCRLGGRLPIRMTRSFSCVLDWAVGPFNWFNYIGSVLGARLVSVERLPHRLDRVTDKLERQMVKTTDTDLHRGMSYPTNWDPFFKDFMTLIEIFEYPVRHFDFHRQQLNL